MVFLKAHSLLIQAHWLIKSSCRRLSRTAGTRISHAASHSTAPNRCVGGMADEDQFTSCNCGRSAHLSYRYWQVPRHRRSQRLSDKSAARG